MAETDVELQHFEHLARLIILLQHLRPDDSLGQLGVILTKSEVTRGKARGYTSSEMYNYMLSRHCPMKKWITGRN
jgi:hypothetical protein